jgi:sugar/nucleoside kinase (ribokinase family)
MPCPLRVWLPAHESHAVTVLSVIGNISRDLAVYPGGRRYEQLGGAALHVAQAASEAGLVGAPVSVIGRDLDWIRADPRLASLELAHVKVAPGPSCAFRLTYTAGGKLASTECSFGVAELLTSHCLRAIGHHDEYHVCCRRPLDVRTVLRRLVSAGLAFSADFHLASASDLLRTAAPFLPHATVVFVNATEFVTLRALMDAGRLAAVVVTDGAHEARLLRYGRIIATAQPTDTLPVEVTGAGDILSGTFLAARVRGLTDEGALYEGVTAASQSIRVPGLAIMGS